MELEPNLGMSSTQLFAIQRERDVNFADGM